MGLSPDAKERLGVVFEVAKTAFHWGFIPTVLYLGKTDFMLFTKNNITSNPSGKKHLFIKI